MVAAPSVLLIGMMAAGKTTVGHALSDLTGWPYLDNDELVRRATGRPTAEVLAAADESTLRRVEVGALDEALSAQPPVIAGVAAGVIIDPVDRRRMSEGAFVVYLRAPVALLAERVGGGDGRPWLDTNDPAAALEGLFEGREPLYCEAADLVLDVDAKAPERLAIEILDALERGDR